MRIADISIASGGLHRIAAAVDVVRDQITCVSIRPIITITGTPNNHKRTGIVASINIIAKASKQIMRQLINSFRFSDAMGK